ncbi:hypothetical protein CC1G_04514 [Coprinopsis cinerea okayama7|uniref:BTB domain-containing protein n=1 Tax=Coprinopsis cinerea (strain Okayama-7 / 130 / ATCC MYA-4618 / FGSC 9003) TaxID=240176 RepID=A8N5D6_COPC7|nr:hypothetical protein CC1G_04514 [Coprinopsis cinerea okayama7\|eukprot:XP_001830081.2 hypothetical protein CC1G_04514 [Coprinopsis cinerea okayama7\
MTSEIGGRFSTPPPSSVPITSFSSSPRNLSSPQIVDVAVDDLSDESEFSLLGSLSSRTPSIVSFSSGASNPSAPQTAEQSPMRYIASDSISSMGGADNVQRTQRKPNVDTTPIITLLSRATSRRSQQASSASDASPTATTKPEGSSPPAVESQPFHSAADALSDSSSRLGATLSPDAHHLQPSSGSTTVLSPTSSEDMRVWPVHQPSSTNGGSQYRWGWSCHIDESPILNIHDVGITKVATYGSLNASSSNLPSSLPTSVTSIFDVEAPTSTQTSDSGEEAAFSPRGASVKASSEGTGSPSSPSPPSVLASIVSMKPYLSAEGAECDSSIATSDAETIRPGYKGSDRSNTSILAGLPPPSPPLAPTMGSASAIPPLDLHKPQPVVASERQESPTSHPSRPLPVRLSIVGEYPQQRVDPVNQHASPVKTGTSRPFPRIGFNPPPSVRFEEEENLGSASQYPQFSELNDRDAKALTNALARLVFSAQRMTLNPPNPPPSDGNETQELHIGRRDGESDQHQGKESSSECGVDSGSSHPTANAVQPPPTSLPSHPSSLSANGLPGAQPRRYTVECETESEDSFSSSDSEAAPFEEAPFEEASFHHYNVAPIPSSTNDLTSPGPHKATSTSMSQAGSSIERHLSPPTLETPAWSPTSGDFRVQNWDPYPEFCDFERDFRWFEPHDTAVSDAVELASPVGFVPPSLTQMPTMGDRLTPDWRVQGSSNANKGRIIYAKSTAGATCGSSVRSALSPPPFVPPSYVASSDRSSIPSSPEVAAAIRRATVISPSSPPFSTSSTPSTIPMAAPPTVTFREGPRVRIWNNVVSYPGESSSGTASTCDTPPPLSGVSLQHNHLAAKEGTQLPSWTGTYYSSASTTTEQSCIAPGLTVRPPTPTADLFSWSGLLSTESPKTCRPFAPTVAQSGGDKALDKNEGTPAKPAAGVSTAGPPASGYDQARDSFHDAGVRDGPSTYPAGPAVTAPNPPPLPQPIPTQPLAHVPGQWGAPVGWQGTWGPQPGPFGPQAQVQPNWNSWQARPATAISRGLSCLPNPYGNTPFMPPPAPALGPSSLPYGTSSLPQRTMNLPASYPWQTPGTMYGVSPPSASYFGHHYLPTPRMPAPVNAAATLNATARWDSAALSQTATGSTSSRFSFSDSTITFSVEDKEYRVHRHFFEQHSTFFKESLNSTPVQERIVLQGSSTDFERLLSLFYPLLRKNGLRSSNCPLSGASRNCASELSRNSPPLRHQSNAFDSLQNTTSLNGTCQRIESYVCEVVL